MEYAYTAAKEGDPRSQHMWTLKGTRGGVHVWARQNDPEWVTKWGERFIGGVERHSPKPVYEFDKEPHHANCFLLGGPCWHDGSSLYFSENIQPMLRYGPPFSGGTHEFIYSVLRDWYASCFGEATP